MGKEQVGGNKLNLLSEKSHLHVIFRLSKLLACQLWEVPSDFLDICPWHACVCVSTENSSVSKAARAGLVNLLEKDRMSSNYG